MTAWPSIYGSTVVVNATLVTTAETIVAQVPVTTDGAASVFVIGWVNVTAGTNATGITLKLRPDSVAGSSFGSTSPMTIAATETRPFLIIAQPTPAEIASRLLVLTVTQVAASANGAVLQAGIIAIPQF